MFYSCNHLMFKIVRTFGRCEPLPRNKGKGAKAESKTAKRYKKGGYKVKQNVVRKRKGRKNEIDIIAERKHEKYAIEVKSGKQTLTSTQIREIYDKLKSTGKEPLLVIYPDVKLTGPAKEVAKKLGLRIKRIKG